MEQKLKQLNAKLEADQGLVEKIVNLENAAEVQKFLKAQGLDFTLEEISSLKNALVKTDQKGELADADLEEVAGGIVVTTGVIATTAAIIGGSATTASFVHTITRSRW